MNKITIRITCLLFCLLNGPPLFSEDLHHDDSPLLGDYVPDAKWQEGKFKLPPYPHDDNLIKVEMERSNTPFNYYIDPDALSIGKDGVVRYTVVIKSPSGASNVLYEGIRCSAREYRTYAYGTSDGKMSKAHVSDWKVFYVTDSMVHRYNFYQYYMCSKFRLPNKKAVILQRIRYPNEFTDGS